MQKWEYKVVVRVKDDELNILGAEGWELVAVTFNEYGQPSAFYFKRPKS